MKAFCKEKVCKPGASFKLVENIVRQLCFTHGDENPSHQSWEGQNSSVERVHCLISSSGFQGAVKYFDNNFEKDLTIK